MKRWFIDTGFAIALSAPRDKFHTRALQLAAEIERTHQAGFDALLLQDAVIH